MKFQVQPGKRPGPSKVLFNRPLAQTDLQVSETGVVITIVANDIYTSKATQRFSITFSQAEIEQICDAMRADARLE